MTTKNTQEAEGVRIEKNNSPQIYALIGQAMAKVGAIGKDSQATNYNGKVMYKFRGIDDVYNALNPVMAELGLFICPEILDQKREERTSTNGTTLIYSIITVKFTMYAPDGSSVSATLIGEGMDSGDKATNKAMSIAMKYFCFQIFMIPTEEMKQADPDAQTHEVLPKGKQQNADVRPQGGAQQASVTMVDKMPAPQAKAPETAPEQPETPGAYIKRRLAELTPQMMDGFNFANARASLIAGGIVEDIPSATIKMDQAVALMDAIEKNFRKPEGK